MNRSPLVNGGNALVIHQSAPNATKRVLQDLFAYYNAPGQSTSDTATPGTWNNHWRATHVADEAWPLHETLGWTRESFEELQRVTSILDTANPSLELRLRGYTSYVYDQFEETMREHMGYMFVPQEEGGSLCVASGEARDISNTSAWTRAVATGGAADPHSRSLLSGSI